MLSSGDLLTDLPTYGVINAEVTHRTMTFLERHGDSLGEVFKNVKNIGECVKNCKGLLEDNDLSVLWASTALMVLFLKDIVLPLVS